MPLNVCVSHILNLPAHVNAKVTSEIHFAEQKGLLHVSGDFWGSAWGDSLRGEAAHPSAGFASRFLLVNTGCGRFALDRWFFIGGGINAHSR